METEIIEEKGEGQLSAKEIGMIQVIIRAKRDRDMDITADYLSKFVRDGLSSINSTLQDLETMGILERRRRKDLHMEYILNLPIDWSLEPKFDPPTTYDRIFALHGRDKLPCQLIADLIDVHETEEPLTDEVLRATISKEMPAAKVIQLWQDFEIDEAFQEVSERSRNQVFSLQDILNYLNDKSSGRIR